MGDHVFVTAASDAERMMQFLKADAAGLRGRIREAVAEVRRNGLGGMTEADVLDRYTSAVLPLVQGAATGCGCDHDPIECQHEAARGQAEADRDRLATELAALREVSRGYCPECGRGDCAPTVEDWEAERRRANGAEALITRVREYAETTDDDGIRTRGTILGIISGLPDATLDSTGTEAHAGTMPLSAAALRSRLVAQRDGSPEGSGERVALDIVLTYVDRCFPEGDPGYYKNVRPDTVAQNIEVNRLRAEVDRLHAAQMATLEELAKAWGRRRRYRMAWRSACRGRSRLRNEVPAQTVTESETSSFQVWPISRILREVRVGSEDWSWDEEFADLDRRHAESGYLVRLEDAVRENGITLPVLIGSDGRLWDGHHRLRIAVRLGIGYVPVELVPAARKNGC